MTRVITYGTFDLLHVGHLNLLERLRALGDELYVAVSTDEFNRGKGKRCVIDYADRARLVAALSCVTAVIPEQNWEQKVDDIKRFQIDVFGMGSDWTGKFDELQQHCRVVYLPRTEGISTTYLRETIAERGLARKTVEVETRVINGAAAAAS
jgi:glycerol-3-phosphate cytidylyltransferase